MPESADVSNSESSEKDFDLSKKLSLTDAVRIYCTLANISFKNIDNLLELLKLVKELTISQPSIKIPTKSEIIDCEQIILKKSVRMCAVHSQVLVNDNCDICQQNNLNAELAYFSIGCLKSQFALLFSDKNFIFHVSQTKR